MAELVANGEQTFLDQNGDPLAGGFVYMYVLNSNNFGQTWKDQSLTILNANPIVLDQAGRAAIWGQGYYRQVVTDQFGNVQWDRTAGFDPSHITGDLNISGNLNVAGNVDFVRGLIVNGIHNTGGLTQDGPATINNNLTVTGSSSLGNAVIQELTVSDTGSIQHLVVPGDAIINGAHVNGALTVNPITGTPGTQSQILVDQILPVTYGSPQFPDGADFKKIPAPSGLGQAINSEGDIYIVNPGRVLRINSGSSPALSLENSADGRNYIVDAANSKLNFSSGDGAGNPVTDLISMDLGGNLILNTGGITLNASGAGVVVNHGGVSVAQAIQPLTNLSVNLGQPTFAWANVYAHTYVTVSTDRDSPALTGDWLKRVKEVKVKTLPHVGIAAEDLPEAAGPEGAGISYNTVVGLLWKALQELNEKFDAYVAAHP